MKDPESLSYVPLWDDLLGILTDYSSNFACSR